MMKYTLLAVEQNNATETMGECGGRERKEHRTRAARVRTKQKSQDNGLLLFLFS